MTESVTVAICTWNRAGLLDQTLTRLAEQRVPHGVRWDLVVVNNNSTDDTAAVLERHAAGRLPLRAVVEPRQGLAHARNRATDESLGDLILWTDDDVDPDPDWLAELAGAFARHPDAAVVGGRVDPWFPTDPDPDLVAVFWPLRIGYCGVDHGPEERELGPDEDVFGANMAFRRSAIAGMKFDPRIGRVGADMNNGDDVTFIRAVRARGGTVVWAPRARLRHYVEPSRMTLGYLKRFYRDAARATVLNEPPAAPVPTLFGLPRWLVRRYAAATVRGWAGLLGGRRARLDALREKWDLAGRIAGYRELARRGSARVPTTTGAS